MFVRWRWQLLWIRAKQFVENIVIHENVKLLPWTILSATTVYAVLTVAQFHIESEMTTSQLPAGFLPVRSATTS